MRCAHILTRTTGSVHEVLRPSGGVEDELEDEVVLPVVAHVEPLGADPPEAGLLVEPLSPDVLLIGAEPDAGRTGRPGDLHPGLEQLAGDAATVCRRQHVDLAELGGRTA